MHSIETVPPAGNEALRQALYSGRIFRLAPTGAAERLLRDVLALLEEELGKDGPVREAQFRLGGEEFFRAIGRLRKILYEEARFEQGMREVIAGWGFDPDRHAIDPLRLRVSTHRGHENAKAAPVYYTHRDTWYSHPQCQISWWLPLHDVTEEETFVFFPEYFDREVENDSGAFDYDTWTRDRRSLRIGWQDANAGTKALYPAFFGDLGPAERLPFSCRAGETLLFSGAHLHQTIPNLSGRTRFSVDFRTVHLDDVELGIGAPNADNRSTGTALVDYLHPPPVTTSSAGSRE